MIDNPLKFKFRAGQIVRLNLTEDRSLYQRLNGLPVKVKRRDFSGDTEYYYVEPYKWKSFGSFLMRLDTSWTSKKWARIPLERLREDVILEMKERKNATNKKNKKKARNKA